MSDPIAFRGGDGPPLVLLHGLMGTWRVWTPLFDTLTARHAVFAPTLPGHHGAAPAADGFVGSIPGIADALEAQLDAAGIDQAHIAGNSLGGWLSLELGRRGRALSVTALSPAGGWRSPRDLKRVVRLMRMAHRMSTKAGRHLEPRLERAFVRKLALRSVAVHGDRVAAEEVAAGLTDAAGCVVIDDLLAWVVTQPSYAPAPQGDYPITIAWSEKDRTIPYKRYGVPLLASVPGAREVVLHDCGHVPMFDDPALVARTILETTGAAPA